MIITSHANPAVKLIRSLRERKARQESGLFYIEGIRIVGEAIQAGAPVENLIVAPELLTSPFAIELLTAQRQSGLPIHELSADVFRKLSLKDNPQGIAAIVRQSVQSLEDLPLENNLGWVVLDAVADPGNLGTILRTSDGVGAGGVILLDNSTDPFDPSAVRASMGALFSQHIVRTTFADFSVWKRHHGIYLAGTSGAAKTDYQDVHYPRPLAIFMGSERQGLPPDHQALCDELVQIPMAGRADSLNLAIATAVMLYEVFNQHRREAKP